MIEQENDTIAAVCTGAGGALNIVRISGPNALGVLHAVWRGSKMPGPEHPRLMCYGRLAADEGAGEPCLAVFMPNPHSYTGEDTAEIQCHGGGYAARRALRLVLDAGARLAQNGEFTRRAFLNGKLDLTQAEGVLDLINAGSDRAGRLAERQLNGAVGSRVRSMRTAVVSLLAECESRLDFSEENLDWMPVDEFCEKVKAERIHAAALAATARAGSLIRDGVSLVIAGPPNAGKSSLMNRMLGYDRAIVTSIPGTTRDTLEEAVSIGGIRFRITDTAGLRDAADADPVEAIGMKRSHESLETADAALWLLDASAPPDSFPAQISAMDAVRKDAAARFIPCWNKVDALPPGASGLPCPDAVPISAKTGEGMDQLFRRLEQTVWDGLPAADEAGGAAVTERHAALLEQAAERLERAGADAKAEAWELAGSSLRAAAELIGGITGETASPDVLDEIFARFCIGK